MTNTQPADLLTTADGSASCSPRGFHAHALGYLRAKLTGYGNEISDDHHTALSALCELAEDVLTKKRAGRFRFGLPCGMGKTTGVRAILKAIHDLGLGHRVVVASSKIEELCSLLRTLECDDGIPRELLGIQHSAKYDPERAKARQSGYASEPSANHDARFLLVTHQNVKSGQYRPWMDDCDLVLFDESLVVGESQVLPFSNEASASIRGELGTLEALSRDFDGLKPAVRILQKLVDRLDEANSDTVKGSVRIAHTSGLDADEIAECRRVLRVRKEGHCLIDQLLDWAEHATELRVYSDDQKAVSLISYSITVPDELQQVIVLDASDPIRELVHCDQRMERAEDVLPSLSRIRRIPGGLASIKNHQRVQVHFANDPGSRSFMSREFSDDVRPSALDKLIRLIKSKPDEGFLVFTFKQRGSDANFQKRILRGLKDSGIEPSDVVREGVSRVSILTWGHETGTNQFSDYENVVLLGVIFQPKAALASMYLGQRDDLRCPQMDAIVKDLLYSECRHSIYQAINRIRVRKVDVVDGLAQAKACNIYVWHHDSRLEESLRTVLRGCPTWLPWREDGEDESACELTMRITVELDRLLEDGIEKISLCRLKKTVSPSSSSTTWGRARDQALTRCAWTRDASSLKALFPS